ncbi:MAG: sugar phosphate isomerase/epimerase [Gemmatimonadetes bacterium]|nr:sugar phosphate isomerase/epimerase [Gemmatimonadota bacterium]
MTNILGATTNILGATTNILGATTRPFNQLPFAEACLRISRAGYQHVAIFANQGVQPIRSDSTSAELEDVGRITRDTGLTPSMVLGRTVWDNGLEDAVTQYRRLIDNSAEVGAGWILDLGTSKEELYEDYVELMRQVAPSAEAAGVAITMKPHGGISLTVEHLVQTHRRVDHPAFGICFDPGNIIYYTKGDRRPEPDVEHVSKLVTSFIVKDCVVVDGEPDVMVTPGDGLVDFPLVLAKLRASGYSGPSYVECVAGGQDADLVERALTQTFGYIRGIHHALPLTEV